MSAWNADNARHLLARCLFGYTRADLAKALSYNSADAFVSAELLASLPQPAPPNPWVTETPVANDSNTGIRYAELTTWWLNRMLTEGTSMREKMVLFWHNHFVSDRAKVNYPQHMFKQNALFRQHAFGDFRQFVKDVTIDPAMLIYLDGRQNNKNAPNENYARELLELFTLGIGNYTETDIKQAAMALTGWRVNGLDVAFNKANFADVSKTFLGKTGNFSYTDIVDIIFTKDAAAEFVCRKLYKEFIFYKPNEAFVKQMADVFRKANYNIGAALRFMLTADEFYKPEYRGAKIKNPVELTVGSLKYLDIRRPDLAYIADVSRTLQQYIFYPPNVAGWPGQRDWISSNTYPARGGFSDSLVNGRRANGQNLSFKVVPLDYARSYKSSEDAQQFVSDVMQQMLTISPAASQQKLLLDTLLDGTIAANWSTNTPMADVRIQKFLKALMRLPEYQLT
ncbi:DUF1800 domain-containing protein [Spirosoma montaniterrae]|uniref:DUF1800 domain-containing protein n=1 Tax=Spirosoma montaniterrae TaxID=1178516 RepID=A0A1P9WSR1_9BACT|nr:DUF1800 domain-containing protein [Spirosoma montaniterrae]AQG78414.1 hypothetical protein AWR27_03115 [Spirosoma montaniterrae]